MGEKEDQEDKWPGEKKRVRDEEETKKEIQWYGENRKGKGRERKERLREL